MARNIEGSLWNSISSVGTGYESDGPVIHDL